MAVDIPPVTEILVGIDGSSAAAHALSWAVDLAARLPEARLVIATVYVADPDGTSSWDDAHEATRQRLEGWCAPARRAEVPYDPVVLDGETGPAMAAAAERHDADLVVVSRRGWRGLDAIAVGSTAEYLGHRSRRPLAVIPPDGAHAPPAHLLVALDGSRDSVAAAAWAAPLAIGLGASVTAAYVSPLPAEAEAALAEQWTAPLHQAGLTPDWRVVESAHPADALIELAQEVRADAIVAGTRSVGGLRPVRLGGVTMHLFHHSPVAVVAVPPPS